MKNFSVAGYQAKISAYDLPDIQGVTGGTDQTSGGYSLC